MHSGRGVCVRAKPRPVGGAACAAPAGPGALPIRPISTCQKSNFEEPPRGPPPPSPQRRSSPGLANWLRVTVTQDSDPSVAGRSGLFRPRPGAESQRPRADPAVLSRSRVSRAMVTRTRCASSSIHQTRHLCAVVHFSPKVLRICAQQPEPRITSRAAIKQFEFAVTLCGEHQIGPSRPVSHVGRSQAYGPQDCEPMRSL